MSEERIRVLQMLEQGTITYEQALALLSALGGQRSSQDVLPKSVAVDEDVDEEIDDLEDEEDEDQEDEDQEDEEDEDQEDDEDEGDGEFDFSELKQGMATAQQEVRQAMNRVAQELRGVAPDASAEVHKAVREVTDGVGEAMRTVGDELRNLFAQLKQNGGWSGWNGDWRNAFTFSAEEEISLPEAACLLDLEVKTKNGSIELAASDDSVIRLKTVKRIQAENQQRAEETATRVVVRQLQQDAERLVLKLIVPEELVGVSVSFQLQVPRRLSTDLKLWSKNGNVRVQDLAGLAELQSKNGSLKVHGGSYRRIAAESKNGSIVLDTAIESATVVSKNGSIRCNLKPSGKGSLQCENKNGSITLELAAPDGQGYSLDATTVHGAVRVELPQFTAIHASGKRQTGQTVGFAESEQQLTIAASTKNGSVTIRG